MYITSFRLFALLSLVYLVNTQSTSLDCPILGPDFPAPQNISTSPLILAAQTSFFKLLSNYTSSIGNDSAFSISLFSVDEDELIFQYHHSPTLPPATGVSTVDADSIYRIGSCTKVFSVWTFLIEVGDSYFSEPVTRYVPELAAMATQSNNNSVGYDEVDKVRWDDVTLGALASQMAGIARDGSSMLSRRSAH